MAIGKFKRIYSVSSENELFPASNLLKNEPGKTWKTKNRGEKQATVVLELEKSQQIIGIDIGNEHSAFFEVLVGKAGCMEDGFKELLITLSLMTPIESKNSTNTHRVRCFSENSLIQPTAKEKWNLVKVICTQPFNKHIQYGLSFIKVHVNEPDVLNADSVEKCIVQEKFNQNSNPTDLNKPKKLVNFAGNFSLREESPDSESESSLALFNRWKMSRTLNKDTSVSAAAAIRAASRSISTADYVKNPVNEKTSEPKVSTKIIDSERKLLNRNRSDLLFGPDDDEPNEKLQKQINKDQEHVKKAKERQALESGKKLKPKDTSINQTNKKHSVKNESCIDEKLKTPVRNKPIETKPSVKNESCIDEELKTPVRNRPIETKPSPLTSRKRPPSPTDLKTQHDKKMINKNIQYKPFNKLLDGVVFVISGIQNPDRADIRRHALAMGAKYKMDWDNSCSHLICAFKNTPKYNQVCGHGKIVTKNWIEKCYSLKKRLPWRRYALDKKEQDKPESEDEILDISMQPEPETKRRKSEVHSQSKDQTSAQSQPSCPDNTIAQYDLDYSNNNNMNEVLSSGSDTDDEIFKVQNLQSKKIIKDKSEGNSGKANNDHKATENFVKDIYELSTDEEDWVKNIKPKGQEPQDFYKNRKFYINSEINAVQQILLKQYIKEFNGELTNYINDADYAISEKLIKTPEDFHGQVVKPLWVIECNEMQCFIPLRRYLFSDKL